MNLEGFRVFFGYSKGPQEERGRERRDFSLQHFAPSIYTHALNCVFLTVRRRSFVSICESKDSFGHSGHFFTESEGLTSRK